MARDLFKPDGSSAPQPGPEVQPAAGKKLPAVDQPIHFRFVGVLHHPKKPESIQLAAEIGRFLRAEGVEEIWFESAWEARSGDGTSA